MFKAIIVFCFLNSQVCLSFNRAHEWYSDPLVCEVSLSWYWNMFPRKNTHWFKKYPGPYIFYKGCYVVPIHI